MRKDNRKEMLKGNSSLCHSFLLIRLIALLLFMPRTNIINHDDDMNIDLITMYMN